MRRKLRGYAAALTAAIVALIAVMTVALFSDWVRHRESHVAALRNMAQVLVNEVERELADIDRALTDIAQQIRARPELLSGAAPQLAEYVRTLTRAKRQEIALGVADSYGIIVASSAFHVVALRPSIVETERFRIHRDSVVTGLHLARPDARIARASTAASLSRGIRDDSGTFLGVVIAIVPAELLVAPYDRAARATLGRVALLRDDNVPLVDDGVDHASAAGGAGSQIVVDVVSSSWPIRGVGRIDRDVLIRGWFDDNGALIAGLAIVLFLCVLGNAAFYLTLKRQLAVDRMLRESTEIRWRDSIESMSDGFALWDSAERLVVWNQRYVEIFPALKDLLHVGLRLSTIIQHTRRGDWRGQSEEVIQARLNERLENHRRGGTMIYETTGQRLVTVVEQRTSDGGVVSIYRDETTERLNERRLKLAEARFRDGIESMREGFTLWDKDDRLITWNKRYCELMPHQVGMLYEGAGLHELTVYGADMGFPHLPAEARKAFVDSRMARRRNRGVPYDFTLSTGRVIEVLEQPTSDGGTVAVYRDVTEARRTLDRLAESEARFRDAMEAMSEGIALWDEQHRLVSWNRRYIDMLPHLRSIVRVGMKLHEINYAANRAVYPDLSEEECARIADERLKSRMKLGMPFLVELPAGIVIEIVDHRTSSGGFVSTFRDVTAAHHAQKQIAQSEARFRDAIESIAEGFVVYDRDDRLLAWNQRYLDLMPYVFGKVEVGRGFLEMLEDSIGDAFPNMSSTEKQDWIARRMVSRARYESTVFETPTGRILQTHERPMSDGGRVVVYRDITSERRLLRQISESEARFRDGIENMDDGFVLWDADDHVTTWNRRIEVLWASFAGEMRAGGSLLDIFASLERAGASGGLRSGDEWSSFRGRMARRREFLGVAFEVGTADGNWIQIVERPTTTGGIVSIFRDVTEIHRAQERLADAMFELERARRGARHERAAALLRIDRKS
jgi:PAS domain-containing protein